MPAPGQNHTSTLLQILPTYVSSTLPRVVVSLTASLYAQSRTCVPTLKREEEIAREYACAVLAIERLKAKLNLPEIERRPPCAPRTFNKLLKYLDGALSVGKTKAVATPTKNRSGTIQQDTDPTPILRNSTPSASSPVGLGSSQKRKLDETISTDPDPLLRQAHTGEAPKWLPDYLTDLRSALRTPPGFERAVTAGVCAVCAKPTLSSSQPATPSKKALAAQQRLPATVVALVILVLQELVSGTMVRETAKTAVKELIVRRVVTMVQFGKIIAEVEAILQEKGPAWTKMSWVQDLQCQKSPAGEAATINADFTMADEPSHAQSVEEQHSAEESDQDSNTGRGTYEDQVERTRDRPLPRGGLTTMLQPRVDWLSPERRDHYAEWKAGMMRKIEELEQEDMSDVT